MPPTDPFAAMDRTLAEWVQRLAPASAPPLSWLIPQTYYTRERRRAFLRQLRPLRSNWGPLLDVGCGLGAMTLECTVVLGAEATGLDRDGTMLALARQLAQAGALTGAPVHWVDGDAYALPFGAESFASAFARFLLQHLSDPGRALGEIHRVLKPGGTVVVLDADDGLSLEEPPPPPAWQDLLAAFARLQAMRGGDRRIGRRLPALLTAAGFSVQQVVIDLNTAWQRRSDADPAWRFERQRIEDSLPDLLAAGLATRQSWEEALAQRQAQLAEHPWMLETAAVCVAVGTKPSA